MPLVSGKWGGARPGSGRKNPGEGQKKVSAVISITERQRDDLRLLRGLNVNVNAILGRYITQLAEEYSR